MQVRIQGRRNGYEIRIYSDNRREKEPIHSERFTDKLPIEDLELYRKRVLDCCATGKQKWLLRAGIHGSKVNTGG